jgi:small subunit ribosomal protein S17
MPDEEKNETTEETPEEPQAEAVEETPSAEAEETPAADEAPAEEPQAEPVEESPAAEEAPAEEPEPAEAPAAEVETASTDEPAEGAEEPAAEQPVAEAEPISADEPAEGAEEAAPAQPVQKPKRKRLPRSERHKHSKPKRERPATRRPIVRLEKPEHARGRRQERRGVVVSDAMDKTIVVKVDTVKAHPKYKKVVRRSAKFHAHDEANTAKVGDLVRIVETRPLSKSKNWRLAEVLEEAK